MKTYDVLIIGAGPAGMTAGIYAVRGGLSAMIIENNCPGGQIIGTYEIENYPGIRNASGADLANNFMSHAIELGVEMSYGNIIDIDLQKKYIKMDSGDEFSASAIIIATGASHRNIGIEVENKYKGKGISFCATCDGAFYKGKTAIVIGGGNTAVEDALYLTKFAKKVYLVHRRDQLRAVGVLADNILKSDVEILWDSKVVDILGEGTVQAVKIENIKTKEIKEIDTDGIFVAIGQIPNSAMFKDVLELTSDGYIKVNNRMQTNVAGVYAIGDIIEKELRQVITACADGAIASDAIIKEQMNSQ